MDVRVTLVACLLFGCAEPVPLSWTVSFSDPSLCEDVVAYEASLERGGCGGEVVYAVTSFRGSGERLATPPTLSPGRWGLRVRARDADCRFVADDCVERELPVDQPALDVALACGAPVDRACAESTCAAGVCVGEDPPPPPRLAWPPSAYATGSVHAPQSARLRWDLAPSATRYEVAVSAPCDGTTAECAFGDAVTETPATDLALADLGLPRVPGGERRAWRVRSCNAAVCGPWTGARVIAIDRLDGDVDGDGYADVWLGEPEAGGGGAALLAGRADVGGAPSPNDADLEDSARLGSAIAAADLDGDGLADALIGAPFADTEAGADAGALIVARGAPGRLALTRLPYGEGVAAETLGASVAVLGDVDGDGFLDVAAGAPQSGANDAGRVVVWHGSADGLVRPRALSFEPAADAAFGAAVAGGDLDGDGYADLVVGEPGRTPGPGTPASGRVLVFRGGPDGLDPLPAVIAPPAAQEALRFGSAVVVLDDLDGDGRADLAVGAPGYDSAGAPSTLDGRVYVYNGAAGGIDVGLVQELPNPFTDPGPGSGERFGVALASADLDGDGVSDLAVGAPDASPGGAAVVYISDGARFDVAPRRFLDRVDAGAGQGRALAAGDVDGDGIADLCVVAAGEEVARLYLGSPTGPPAGEARALTTGRYAGACAIGR